MAFPQGSLAPEARAGSDRLHGREEWDKHSPPGQFFDRKGRVAPSPALRPDSGERIRQPATETRRGQRVSISGASEKYAHKYATKGGLT